MPARLYLPLALLCLAIPALAATEAPPTTSTTLTSTSPTGLTLHLDIGQLQTEQVALAGRSWTSLSLQDGSKESNPGQPELPVWTSLVIVPEGAVLSITATASDKHDLTDLDLAPRRPDDREELVLDQAWYDAGLRTTDDLVTIGTPARMGGVTVASIVVRPVSYDAATRRATVAGQVDVQLTWQGGQPLTSSRITPTSARILADAALNSPPIDANQTLGTWVAILPSSTSVRNAMEPLIDWRRRQGYHVIVADLNDTGPTNTHIKSYLQNLYNTLEIPLEFVTLVGDATGTLAIPTWSETRSGLNGEGDHQYTLLDGTDMLSDIQVGRLSCRTITELNGIVAKIVGYETDPPRDDPDWFTRAMVVGDPADSGDTTLHCARWLWDQLYLVGFERVNTVDGGHFLELMMDGLDQGMTVFGYRGFYGMSGFNAPHALVLNNGLRLPFAMFPTCDTGSFRTDSGCRSETFLRNPQGGAIGAIGTATSGTHTRYNNCFFYGTFEGLLHGSDHRQGVALNRGKLEMFRQYGVAEPNIVEIWSTWHNLMGDPATDIWLGVPQELAVSYPATLPAAASSLPVTVLTGGVPLAGAHVATVQGADWRAVAVTNEDGEVLLPLDSTLTGTITITVTGHGLVPHQGSAMITDQDHWVALHSFTIDGDEVVTPAEEVALDLTLLNLGQHDATGVSVEVTSMSPWLTVIDGNTTAGPLASGETGACADPCRITVAPDSPAACQAQLRAQITTDTGSWTSQLDLVIEGSDFHETGLTFSAGDLDPGTTTDLTVALENTGTWALTGAQAKLRSRSLWVSITDSTGTFGSAAPGEQVDNAVDPFTVTFAADMVRGASVPLTLVLEEEGGALRRLDLNIPVGDRGLTDPAGPDAYGYFAFDNGDIGYPEAHPFDWVEIDSTRGGPGSSVGLTDYTYERDDTSHEPLPFAFRYYGYEYNTLSICSNGWIAFGESKMINWRNWSLPAAGSPDAMVAVFWDDLVQTGSNRVYHWFDEAEHRYIVQWSRMQNATHGQQTCQVILYDPEFYPTLSRDGIIVCQYLEVANNDMVRNYATLGIQSPDGTDGICYSYYTLEPPGAPAPQSGLAITYVPKGRREPLTCDVSPTSFAVTLPPNDQVTHTLHIANNGEDGQPLTYAITQIDPEVGNPLPGDKSLTGCTLTVDETGYMPGEPLEVHLTVYNGSPDNEWIGTVLIDLPPGVNLLEGTDLADEQYRLFWEGNSGDGATAAWQGEGSNFIHQYDTAHGSFTIEVDYGVGDLDLAWTMIGDIYGEPPHEISGSFPLAGQGNLLNITSPNGGEFWSLGEQRSITWEHSPDVTEVALELSRDGGASWETLAGSLPASDLSFDWTVTGEVSGDCRVRLTSADNALVTDTSFAPFTIQNDLTWLAITPPSGEVIAGNIDHLVLDFDATGLAEGIYQQILLIANNAEDDLLVPVTLTVSGGVGIEEVPLVTALSQNHPNPFNPQTSIDFALKQAGPVDLAVYDLTGQRVARLVRGEQAAGRHTVFWDGRTSSGRSLASGTYVYRLVTDQGVLTRKLTLLK